MKLKHAFAVSAFLFGVSGVATSYAVGFPGDYNEAPSDQKGYEALFDQKEADFETVLSRLGIIGVKKEASFAYRNSKPPLIYHFMRDMLEKGRGGDDFKNPYFRFYQTEGKGGKHYLQLDVVFDNPYYMKKAYRFVDRSEATAVALKDDDISPFCGMKKFAESYGKKFDGYGIRLITLPGTIGGRGKSFVFLRDGTCKKVLLNHKTRL